jgi:acetyl-CoA synthetase
VSDANVELVNPIVRRWQRDAAADPDAFWARAAEMLPWSKPWHQVFDWQPPTFKWYLGGETNLCANAIDRHVAAGNGGRAALVALDERGGRDVYTYAQLHHEVKRAAAALRGAGIGTGDRVAVYMPTCAEAIVLMLACARIGAIHLVVFAGFGANALAERVKLAGCKALFAADITYRRGRDVDLLGVIEDTLADPDVRKLVQQVVVLKRSAESTLPSGALTWDEFLTRGAGQDESYVPLESNTPLFILATSGTTATPKLVVHCHGGYQVYIHAMAKWVFGLRPDEVWWSTSDIGWVVGHSYMVYAPLLVGCTTLSFEGAIDYPDIDTFYKLCAENGVTGVFTSPTAIRVFMRSGAEPARKYDLS